MNIIATLSKIHNWNLPTVCPVCSSALALNDNHCKLSCTNDFCQSKFAGRINKWTNVMEIKEFGLNTINTLIENNVISTISSLYEMDLNKIAQIEGFGKRSAEKMKKQLDLHKEMTLAKFIAGYNIEGCGEKIIENILKHFNIVTYNELMLRAQIEKSFVCEGVGEIISNKLVEGMNKMADDMVKTLDHVIIKKPELKTLAGSLNGKSFCFTGAATRSRKELWAMVEANGGVVFEGVKKGLDYLVLADVNSTSSKAVKARKDGITLISEDDFVAMCGV